MCPTVDPHRGGRFMIRRSIVRRSMVRRFMIRRSSAHQLPAPNP
jgi:hypothetical protein